MHRREQPEAGLSSLQSGGDECGLHGQQFVLRPVKEASVRAPGHFGHILNACLS